MEQAAMEEKARKAAALEASRKRTSSATPIVDIPDSKRPKLEHDTSASPASGFDFSSLPASLVTDLIVANLQAFTENALIGMVQAYRHKKTASVAPPAAPTAGIPGLSSTPPPAGPSRPMGSESVLATPPPAATRAPPSEPRADRDRKARSPSPPPQPQIKQEEPVDPLKMDIDDEEIEYEPERLNMEVMYPN